MSNALELNKFERLEWLSDDTPVLVCENVTLNWRELNWKKIERRVFKLTHRIYRASKSGDKKLVRKLQKMMAKSWYAKLLATRRVTQENKGKKTAGVDGVKSLSPKERFELIENLKIDGKAKPVRRVWIPKPGKKEMRPLGIPTIQDRAKQMLLKLALEPEWEAVFEPNSYGFRPGRSCHDAVAAIFNSINKKSKYVLDADIAKCFDKISHTKLLEKLNTFPAFKRQIKAWLKAGVIDFSSWAGRKGYDPTSEGTPQGGVISPLLANIALHGMEACIENEFPSDKKGRWIGGFKTFKRQIGVPRLIRYADDFVILCEELSIVQRCQEIIALWLKDIGLELKPSKTRLAHSLNELGKESPGFNFLGFNIRQYKVGKHHSGKSPNSKEKLGFKTIIKPSPEKIKAHYQELVNWIDHFKGDCVAGMITKLNPIIRGWCNYQSPWHSKVTFGKVKNLMWNKLWRWAKSRHPNKNRNWISRKYFRNVKGDNWSFSTSRSGKNPLVLLKHPEFPASVKWVKVEGTRSPYDGDWAYWSTRIGDNYKVLEPQKARLFERQKGDCAYCGLKFMPEDNLEKHHLNPKGKGGNNSDENMALLHLHCHDQLHSLKGKEYDEWVNKVKSKIPAKRGWRKLHALAIH
ncbi:MAG: group II intron reverse transcriptase/maturase [Tolypothrix carrinoi HA7290-LM1]|nr:group II intron reverse transcriptase/maturase [Tolypothrix carrinoi HA7290-LM1]